MWKLGFVVLILSWGINGQNQFLREVTHPSGPSQVILRGGALNSIGNGEEGGQQVEERYVLTDQPQPQNEQALPFQSPQESPIPEDGGENNPFTNGENGFGLRLSQQGPAPPQVQRQVQQVQAARPQQPQVLQPQYPGPQYPIFQQQQQPVEIDQPAPIIHQTEVNLPQLPAGQQYVDVYGRPIILEQPPQVVQQVAPTPQVAPAPSPSPTPTSAPTLPPPPTQVLVDQYGRQLTQIQHQPQYVTQQFLQPGAVPVAHHVLQPAVPHVQHVLQPASVAIPAIAAQTQLVAHSPGLTLQTYAVPAVRKVGNLVIPYAQKVQYAAKIPKVDIVFPPTVPAPAVVKSRHRTVFSPTKVLTPAVHEVHHHVQPVQEVHHHVQPVQEVHHHVQPVQEVHHHVQPAQEVHHHVQPVQEVHHHVQPAQEVQHHVQPVQEVHHFAPPVPQVQALPAPVPVVNLSHAAPQLLQYPPGLVPVPAPQVLHHPPGLVPVPAPQVLHHPPGLVPVPAPQVLHHPPGLVPVHAPGQVLLQHPPPVALAPHPQQVVQVGQPIATAVPVGPQVVEHHLHPQPHAVVPAVHVEKHIIPGAPAPVLVKKVKPLITKTIVPEVTLIHQPILPKVLFQRHIFNVKHGSEPIIYQDLCTVYPYQKNLRACVLKKATLPELHHPDIRTINVEESQHQTDQSVIAAGSPIVAPAPPTSSPSVTVTKALPQNIQDTIRRESARLKEAATKNTETTAAEAPSTSAQPDTAESRTNSSSSGKSRRKKNKGSTSRQTTTTERPFKLA